MSDVATRTGVEGADLLNLLNYVNFREGTVFVQFRHRRKGDRLTFPAFPLPSQGEILECRWLSPGLPAEVVAGFDVEEMLVSDGRNLVVLQPQVQELRRDGVVFQLPGQGTEKALRSVRRHRVQPVLVKLLQSGFQYEGTLRDFHAVSFRIHLGPAGRGPFGLNPTEPITVVLEVDHRIVYSGEARFGRIDDQGDVVVTPLASNLRRFPPRQVRNPRVAITPSPQLKFTHPLTGQVHTLPVVNVAGGGLGVEEFSDEAVLLPGLILPRVTVEWANQVLVEAPTQVLHRQMGTPHGNRPTWRCGLVFLDMAMPAQALWASVLQQADNPRLRVCSPVDEEELWRFFFESGFFYASKYAALEAQRAAFRATYRKLYQEPLPVSRHFLFEDQGRLLAHMSMVRSHPRTWLIHHHAATRSGHVLAGVAVLDQIGRYINDFHRLPQTHMDYVTCYFRRENKFPNRVFGGTATDVADRRGISLDDFAYVPLPTRPEAEPQAYQILPASAHDLGELRVFYEATSGGLLLDALNLLPHRESDEEIDGAFEAVGLVRSQRVFAWKHQGTLKAVIAVQTSDPGLNLSNLTHCIHAFWVDRSGLTADQGLAGLWDLRESLGSAEMPLLVYPADALEGATVPVDKRYTAWVLAMSHLDGYFHSIDRRFRRRPHGPA